MPCKPQRARKLLKEGKARVVRRTPFTIKLKYGSGTATQEVVAGMDTGSKKIGCAAVANGKVLYASEVTLRSDVSKKMKQRSMYRRTRRNRKTRYRPARWENRANSKREGKLPPSIRSKLESHLREKRFVESILPVSQWRVETAQFDIHKITNPLVFGKEYQDGPQKDFLNVKAYILFRDGYKCLCKEKGRKHSEKLHVHHIIWRRDGGTDEPGNLIVLCEDCHKALHAGMWELPKTGKRKVSRTKHATHMGIIQSQLKKVGGNLRKLLGTKPNLKGKS